LEANDINSIERAVAKVENDINRVTFARAEVGARWRGLILSEQSLQEEEIQLRSALSDEIDVDLVEAISQLTARQISLEASLRSSATILQLSLLNYI
jgi:flagellar hook-associated protein 3 FlgL